MGSCHGETIDPQCRRYHRQGFCARATDRGRRAVASAGRQRTHRHAEQVRPERRSALTERAASDRPRRLLFVTGRLAEPALRRVLAEMEPDFACDVAVMGITVAALMTTDWIARALR